MSRRLRRTGGNSLAARGNGTQMPSAVFPMTGMFAMATRGFAQCWVGLFALLVLIIGQAGADQATIVNEQGVANPFPEVTIEGAAQANGTLVFQVVPPGSGQGWPLPVSRIQSISFGANGEGTKFNLTLMDEGGGVLEHPDTTFLSFDGTLFQAMPSGSTQAFGIPANRVVSMTRPAMSFGNSGLARPVATAPLPESTGPDFDAADASGTEEFTFDEPEEPSTEELMALVGVGAAVGGILLILVIVNLISLVLWLGTAVWMTVHAAQEGEWLQIAGMWLLCCGYGPMKCYYAWTKYDGKGAGFVKIWTVIEFVLFTINLIVQQTG